MREVVVYLLEGRSLEQKRGLVKDGGQECRHDRRTGHGVAGRDTENVKGQGRHTLQRDGRPLIASHSHLNQASITGVNNPVSAVHNELAALQ